MGFFTEEVPLRFATVFRWRRSEIEAASAPNIVSAVATLARNHTCRVG